MSYPIAMIIKRRPNRDNPEFEIATIRCPLCKQTHEHGLNPKNINPTTKTAGHRVGHCCDPFASKNREAVEKGYILRVQ